MVNLAKLRRRHAKALKIDRLKSDIEGTRSYTAVVNLAKLRRRHAKASKKDRLRSDIEGTRSYTAVVNLAKLRRRHAKASKVRLTSKNRSYHEVKQRHISKKN